MKQIFDRLHSILKPSRSREKWLEEQNERLRQRVKSLEHQLKEASALKGNEFKRLRTRNRRSRQKLSEISREHLLYRMPKEAVCAGLGVGEGSYSRQILDVTQPARLHLIYPEPEEESRGYDGPPQDERVRVHREASNVVPDEFEDSSFDWVYIDGNHRYGFVKRNLEACLPKVKDGGYITGNEYGVHGRWNNGVQKAVDELVSQRSGLLLEVKGTQFIIEKGAYTPAEDRSQEASPESLGTDAGTTEGTLPKFITIGAQKGGTSFLYNLLTQHPDVEPAAKKELDFFSHRFDRGVGWYRSCFPELTGEKRDELSTTEASPSYLYHPHAARRAARTIPGARLIVLLRDPVDRAYSHYQHQVRMGNETLSFEEAVDAEKERLRGEREKMLKDEHYGGADYFRFSYLSRGIYADQFAEWYGHFGEDRILVLKSEDFFGQTRETLETVLGFLGLPNWEPETVQRRKRKYSYEEMDSSTRRRLEEYFEPHNQRLYEYLGKDFGW